MSSSISAAEHGAPAFRAVVSDVMGRGPAVAALGDATARQAAVQTTMLEPLERLLGHHGLGRFAPDQSPFARINYDGVRPTAIQETISAVRFLRESSQPAEHYMPHGADDIGHAIGQLRNALLHA